MDRLVELWLKMELLLLQVQAQIWSALNFGNTLASCCVCKHILTVDNRVVVVGIVCEGGGVEKCWLLLK